MMIGTPKELGAINGVLVKRDMPNEPFVNYITVDSIGKICKIIEKNGGTIIIPKKSWVNGAGGLYLRILKETSLAYTKQAKE